jgi:hypothetical protein
MLFCVFFIRIVRVSYGLSYMCCVSDVAQQVIKIFDIQEVSTKSCRVKLILSQPKFGFNIKVKKHLNGRNLVLKSLILNLQLGKPLNWGTLNDSCIDYFTLKQTTGCAFISSLQRLFKFSLTVLKCRLKKSLLGVSSVFACWSPFCHCCDSSFVSLQ